MTIERAEEVLTDPGMAILVDTVLRRTPNGYRAASSRGSVDFRRADGGEMEVIATSGDNPIGNEQTDQRLDREIEIDDPWASLGDHATPYAMDSTAQYFDSPHAPDLVVLHAPTHRFHGNAGEHGSLATTQARAPFIAAGPGIVARGVVAEHLRTVDVAPTVAALLGCPPIDGHDGLGAPRSDVRLKVQDGTERSELLDLYDLPAHVVVFLWDGINPNALHAAADAGEAPQVAALIERGTSYRHGAIASLPTATLGNHMTESTGVFPGRSGVLHNTWYQRDDEKLVDLLDLRQMVDARDYLRADIETIHEALHRHKPGARTATTYEYGDRGADWSTYIQMAKRDPSPPPSEDLRRRHRTEEFMGHPQYRAYSGFDAHSMADALRIWSGDMGKLPEFSWFTLNLTDTAGHSSGPQSDMIGAAIRDSDGRMGEVINQIDRAGKLDRTAIIMLADHGMQQTAEGEPADVSASLSDGGVDHMMVDAQYVYLR